MKRVFCPPSSLFLLTLLVGCGTVRSQVVTGAQGPAGPAGLIFLNAYNPATTYTSTDVVTYQGSSYVALGSVTNVAPVGATTSTTYWAVLAQAGAVGAQGVAGAQGAAGPKGDPGQSIQGPQGVSGTQGLTGSTGPQGLTGQKGDIGSQGVPGPQGPTGALGPQGPAGVITTASISPWNGKVMGIIGDSYCVFNIFQKPVAAYHGMTLGFQDCRGGRPIGSQTQVGPNASGPFECYGGTATGTNLGTGFSPAQQGWGNCAQITTGTFGNTYAQDIAQVDLMLIQLGANDIYSETLGSLTDTASTQSTYGYIRSLLEQLITIRPTMRIVWVTPNQMTSTDDNRAGQLPGITQAILNVCAQYSVPVINMLANSGITAKNASLYLSSDGIHLNSLGFTNLYERYIETQLQTLNPID